MWTERVNGYVYECVNMYQSISMKPTGKMYEDCKKDDIEFCKAECKKIWERTDHIMLDKGISIPCENGFGGRQKYKLMTTLAL